MELSRGACYVAVKPPDKFVAAGYEKYLIRASRSREKRQAQRSGSVAIPDSDDHTEMTNPDVGAEEINDELRKENSVLRTINSSMVIQEASPKEKLKSELAIQDKPKPLRSAPAVKPTERKNTSIPRPAVRKFYPPTPPAPNLKPSFRKKDSLRTSNVKITKPEGDRNSSSGTSSNHPNKLVAKSKVYKATTRPKETTAFHETVLKKVKETESELKDPSAIKIVIDNDNKASSSSANLKNVIEDKNLGLENKNLVLVSNLIQNPQSDNNSLVTSYPIHIQNEPKTYHTETANLNETLEIDSQEDIKPQNKINRETKTITTKNSKEVIEIIESPLVRHSIVNNEHLDKRYANLKVTNALKGDDMINKVNYEINENNKTNDTPPLKHSVVVITEELSYNRCESHNNTIDGNVDGNVIANNEVKITNEAYKNYDLTSTFHSTATDDQYVAILNKGDVVNLKLNIEIKNHGGGLPKYNDDTVNLRYVNSKILHTEKESQVNIANEVVTQNNSQLSLITKEIKNHPIRDNHRVFIVKSGACKYCNVQNVEMSDSGANKSNILVLPIEKFEDNPKGCPCDAPPQNCLLSACCPAKPTFSCISVQSLTKPSQMEHPVEASSSIHVATPDVKCDEIEVLASSMSDKDDIMVVKKKSVAINAESMPCECSKIGQINIKRCSHSTGTPPRNIMDNSTQTEWCDVLLEARLLEDGHYAFRLPTLEMLKYYNLR